MKRIAFIVNNLKIGGIQRSLINLLKNLDSKKYKVDCYLYNKNGDFINQVPSNINLIYLKSRIFIIRFIPFNLAKVISKSKLLNIEYDYVVDFDGYQTDASLEVILSNSKCKIFWIHQNLLMKSKKEIKYKILHFFMKNKFKYYDKFVGVSKGVIEPFELLNDLNIKNNCVIIPNYIDTKKIFDGAEEKTDFKVNKKVYNFVTVGRLHYAKGFDILLNNIYELKKLRTDFHLYIIGEGKERKKLEAIIRNNDLKDFVTLLGNQTNPFKYMKLMDGFVLTSRYEGQGMVIQEALSLGLEIFITKNLEQYNEDLTGYSDIVSAMGNAVKKEKVINNLDKYNNEITKRINNLLS